MLNPFHLKEVASLLSEFPISSFRTNWLTSPHSHDGERQLQVTITENRTYESMIAIGECKPIIADYLRCLRRVKGTNDLECRLMAKEYLRCRMEQYVPDRSLTLWL